MHVACAVHPSPVVLLNTLRAAEAETDIAKLQQLISEAALTLDTLLNDAARLNWLERNFIHATDNDLHAPLCIYWGRNVPLRHVIDRELKKLRK